jgi:putative hydrolase of the HAD superfamily
VRKERAIVFDLDDTLYPERDFVHSGFRAAAAWAETHLGVPRSQAFEDFFRLSAEEGKSGHTFDHWLASHGIDAGHARSLIAAYRKHEPEIRLFPEVPRLLHRLRQENALGLVSDGYLDVQQRKFAALGLGNWIQAAVFSDQWGREFWKPHPRPFETVLERIGVAAEKAVYVADNPAKDFAGARRVGMATVRVRFGGIHHRLLPASPDHAADHDVDDFADLESLLVPAQWRMRMAS